MAIIVEEEKNTKHIAGAAGWLAILIVLGFAAYYLFFAPVPSSTGPLPANLQKLTPLANMTLDPQSVLQGAAFTALQPPPFALPTSTGPVAVGRPNPFVAP